jgi:hypothetical protein
MKLVEKYKTYDGVEHSSRQMAERHLDNKFSAAVSKISNTIPLGRGVGLAEYIVEHLDWFLEMQTILDDKADLEED